MPFTPKQTLVLANTLPASELDDLHLRRIPPSRRPIYYEVDVGSIRLSIHSTCRTRRAARRHHVRRSILNQRTDRAAHLHLRRASRNRWPARDLARVSKVPGAVGCYRDTNPSRRTCAGECAIDRNRSKTYTRPNHSVRPAHSTTETLLSPLLSLPSSDLPNLLASNAFRRHWHSYRTLFHFI